MVKDVTRELSSLAIYRIDFRIWHVRLRVLMENPKGGAWLGEEDLLAWRCHGLRERGVLILSVRHACHLPTCKGSHRLLPIKPKKPAQQRIEKEIPHQLTFPTSANETSGCLKLFFKCFYIVLCKYINILFQKYVTRWLPRAIFPPAVEVFVSIDRHRCIIWGSNWYYMIPESFKSGISIIILFFFIMVTRNDSHKFQAEERILKFKIGILGPFATVQQHIISP